MRRFLFLLALSVAVPVFSQSAASSAAPLPERHEYVLHNFQTESGVVLPEAHLVYGTTGTLNAEPSWFRWCLFGTVTGRSHILTPIVRTPSFVTASS